MSEFEWLFMLFVSVVVVVAAFIPKTPIRRYPQLPPPPPPPPPMYGVDARDLLKIMHEDLEDFKAGRPSMLQKAVDDTMEDLGDVDWDEDAKGLFEEGK